MCRRPLLVQAVRVSGGQIDEETAQALDDRGRVSFALLTSRRADKATPCQRACVVAGRPGPSRNAAIRSAVPFSPASDKGRTSAGAMA
jgi:hypothetical protein